MIFSESEPAEKYDGNFGLFNFCLVKFIIFMNALLFVMNNYKLIVLINRKGKYWLYKSFSLVSTLYAT